MSFFDSSTGEPPMPVNVAQPYNQSRETSSSIWKQNRELLARLYQQERKTLREVERIMEEQHGFPNFPLSTYETKLRDELGLKKKLKAKDWIAIHHKLVATGDRKCEVHLNGVPIPQWKVKKEIKRNLQKFGPQGNSKLSDTYLGDIIIHPLPLEANSRDSQQSTPSLSDALETTQPNHITDPFNENILSIGFPELDGLRSPSDMLFCFGSLPRVSVENIGDMFLSLDAPCRLPVDWNGDDMMLDWPDEAVTSPALLVETTLRNSSSLIQDLQQLKISVPLTKTLEIVAAFARSTSYASHASILHPEFKKRWSPSLDDLPIFRFQSVIDNIDYSVISSLVHSGQAISNEQLVPGAASRSELSLSMSPFYILSTALYYLSNNFTDAAQMEQIIEWFSSKVPPSLARSFLRLPSLSMRESWINLLNSAYLCRDRGFFFEVANAAVEENDWLRAHEAWCLVLAAGLDCASLCEQLIALGVAPDKPYFFLEHNPQISQYEDNEILRDTIESLARVQVDVNVIMSRNSQFTYKNISTLPLVEAVVKGNIEAAKVLLENGAEVNHRCGGMTAAGYIVLALSQGDANTESRIRTLGLLLEKGEDIDEPAWEGIGEPPWKEICSTAWKDGTHHTYEESPFTSSQETLLDIAYLTPHHEALAFMTKFSLVPESTLTISKVISSAKLGVIELQSCLDRAKFPKGVPRRRIQRAALSRSIDTPMATLAILRAKVDIEDRGSFHYHNFGLDGYAYATSRAEESLVDHFLSSPVTADGVPIIRILMQYVAIDNSLLAHEYLALHADMSGDRGIMLFIEAARRNNFGTVRGLLQRGFDVNRVMGSGVYKGMSVLLLIASQDKLRSVGPIHSTGPASVEMLELLHGAGATIPECNLVMESTFKSGVPCRFDPAQLKWLFDRGFESQSLQTKSIFTILMEMVDLTSLAGYGLEGFALGHEPANNAVLEFTQYLDKLNIPPCNPVRTLGDGKVTEKPCYENGALVCFILIGTGLEFCLRLINLGLDLNEPFDLRECECICGFMSEGHECVTPLEAAVGLNNLKLVQELIRCGADVKRSGCATALQIACLNSSSKDLGEKRPDHLEIAHCLLLNRANPDTVSHSVDHYYHSKPPLQLALRTRPPSAELVELLLKFGANANATSREFKYASSNALWVALSCDEAGTRRRLVELLIHHGAEVDVPLDHGMNSSLFKACEIRDIEMITLLLARGACPNRDQQTYRGSGEFGSPLALFAKHGDIPAALLLREAGAILSGQDNSLEIAAQYGRLDMVQLLLKFEERKEAFIRAIGRARMGERLAIKDLIARRVAEVYSGVYEEIITNRISEAHIDGTMDDWDKEDTMYLVRYVMTIEKLAALPDAYLDLGP
ncbi:ankyrin unc44 [Seiridium cupressi]